MCWKIGYRKWNAKKKLKLGRERKKEVGRWKISKDKLWKKMTDGKNKIKLRRKLKEERNEDKT